MAQPALKDLAPTLIDCVKENQRYFKRNTSLYEINEGDILPHILNALSQQFSVNTFEQMTFRVPPINLLRRVINKLSRIYQPGPSRSVVNGTPQDNELLGWYEKIARINSKMNQGNKYFNLFKNTLVHICLVDGEPALVPVPSDRYYIFGLNPMNPMKVTHVVTFKGVYDNIDKRKGQCMVYTVYSDTEFMIVQSDNVARPDLMEEYGNPDGINPIGKLPFIYITKSSNEIIPLPDSDLLNMSLILPQAFTDLNAGIMFQVFSIFYGIGVSPEGLKIAPNAFWNFKVDPGQEGKSEVGILKPTVDINQALSLIQVELAIWFQSLGIKPGASGQLTGDNYASGISKIIDEMDTAESRNDQIAFFQPAENELWDYIINYAHPYWLSAGLLKDQTLSWSPGAQISVNFAEQLPLQSRADLLDEQVKEILAGLTTVRRAIRKLNPEMNDNDIDSLLEDIQSDKSIKLDQETIQNVIGKFQQTPSEAQAQTAIDNQAAN